MRFEPLRDPVKRSSSLDIPDPMGRPRAEFEAMARTIDAAVPSIVDLIARSAGVGGA
ncbi:hypothetical protein [Corynebacterium liangguodongii]|uniref:hypothetical protein n=1 Tax=Corynebacterium liangguodongii TaxID=2079535 RepID=UPI001304C556|nr:hypothetical protein [Corynebacterium liangguodongii]